MKNLVRLRWLSGKITSMRKPKSKEIVDSSTCLIGSWSYHSRRSTRFPGHSRIPSCCPRSPSDPRPGHIKVCPFAWNSSIAYFHPPERSVNIRKKNPWISNPFEPQCGARRDRLLKERLISAPERSRCCVQQSRSPPAWPSPSQERTRRRHHFLPE